MSSTFLGLNTAYTGLQSSNASLNTTANNISNAETKGYSRQVVTTQAAEAIRSFTTYGCVGAGVETIAIERVRDNFYDQKYWNNQTKLGEYEAKQYYMQVLEQYYTDDDTVNGFTTVYEDFYKSVQELSKNAGDTTVRQQMIGQAGRLTTYFNDMYTNLQKMQSDINQEVKVQIDRINSVAEEIASLNKQINIIEMNTGAVANELRDQRDMLVDELAEIVDVEVTEVPIVDSNNEERTTGGNRFMVKICGQQLIDGKDYKTLTCVVRDVDNKVCQSDIDGLYDIYFSGGQDWTDKDYLRKGDALNIYGSASGGKLYGLMQMRDGNNGEGFEGEVVNTGAAYERNIEGKGYFDSDGSGGYVYNPAGTGQYDKLDTVKVKVTADYLMDLNKLNLTQSGGVIQIASKNYYITGDWTFDYTEGQTDAAGKPYAEFTFTLDHDRNSGSTVMSSGSSVFIGRSISYQGIPYYMSQMNEWVRMYSTATNNIYSEGITDQGTDGINFFNCEDNGGVAYTFGQPGDAYSYELTGTAGHTISIKSTDPSYYMLTAGNFKVNEALIKDADLLATRKKVYSTESGGPYSDGLNEGVSKDDIVSDIIDLKTNKNRMEFRGCASDQYLVCVLSDVALNTNRANNFTNNYQYLQNSIQNQRLSVFGVDNDEEAVNLTKYQQQYNMASKMIQTLTEIYDRLILQTGV